MNYLIENCDIYCPNEIIENGILMIKGSRIHRIFSSTGDVHQITQESEVTRLDAKGGVVVPGFIDLHVHGGYNVDVTDNSLDNLGKMINFHLTKGTTGLLLTTLSGSCLTELKQQVAILSKLMDYHHSILGIHLEGPFLNTNYRGMFPADAFRQPCLKELQELVDISDNSIRMITIAPELEGAMDLINWCSQNGIVASFGHSGADYETVRKAINMGLSQATHVFNAMVPLHHRNPGGLGTALMDDRLSVQVICDGIHLHPLIIQMLVRLKGPQNICLITDANRSAGMPYGEYELGTFGTVHYNDGRVTSANGQLAGTALTMIESFRNILSFGQISFLNALHTVSTTPACSLGLSNFIGSIQEGNDADLLILDRELHITDIFLKGAQVSQGTLIQ